MTFSETQPWWEKNGSRLENSIWTPLGEAKGTIMAMRTEKYNPFFFRKTRNRILK